MKPLARLFAVLPLTFNLPVYVIIGQHCLLSILELIITIILVIALINFADLYEELMFIEALPDPFADA